jgi:hypothetical protein
VARFCSAVAPEALSHSSEESKDGASTLDERIYAQVRRINREGAAGTLQLSFGFEEVYCL